MDTRNVIQTEDSVVPDVLHPSKTIRKRNSDDMDKSGDGNTDRKYSVFLPQSLDTKTKRNNMKKAREAKNRKRRS